MMQGSRISATQNLWVVSVFPTFTGSGIFPSIPASSPVTVRILQSVGVHPVSGSTPGRTMEDGGARVHVGPAGVSLDGTEEVEAVCVAHFTNLVVVLNGVYGRLDG